MGLDDEEVVAVLGHELGHWHFLHNVINIVMTEVKFSVLSVSHLFLYFLFVTESHCCHFWTGDKRRYCSSLANNKVSSIYSRVGKDTKTEEGPLDQNEIFLKQPWTHRAY